MNETRNIAKKCVYAYPFVYISLDIIAVVYNFIVLQVVIFNLNGFEIRRNIFAVTKSYMAVQ